MLYYDINRVAARSLKNLKPTDSTQIKGDTGGEFAQILTPEAISFVTLLSERFEGRRQELLKKRKLRQEEINAGRFPDFLEETRSIRESDWTVASIPHDLLNRKVEITGPVDRKMIVNALNSGANVFMADFEDSHTPTWANNIQGQLNLRDAVRGTISFQSPEGKQYILKEKIATLMVRPRGWHLHEKHFCVDGKPVSASLFDFGLFFFHNAKTLIDKGNGPYFYLPKMESHLEARLWNDVFNLAQDTLDIPRGTIRATVLIETILAAFEMDEILYELRDHSAGLNCGRWDYIFSFIKKFKNHAAFVLPDRAEVTMTQPFLKSYVELLIQTCHRREIHAMGGMAAQIPIKSDPAANDIAFEKVRQDKLREANAGHDGTWVAHPGLIPTAMEIFERHLGGRPNQIENKRVDVKTQASDLLVVPKGSITEKGLRTNINVGVLYLESWLRGIGCVPLYNLMEDAATAEISRTQAWQWLRHGSMLDVKMTVTRELIKNILDQELHKIRETVGAEKFKAGPFEKAASLFYEITVSKDCPDFLTSVAYEHID